ncbi:MAG TPA: 4-diphosphocytidyl-2C-methyl-D-erythritol kinase, partial [Rhizobium sp.]|nr:4-diphosphocytidyl-2C-methyl-D-erythritol kinase [Rhizobium sp.]
MIFGEFLVEGSVGLILAHSVRLPEGRLGKGHRITDADVARLQAAGVALVIACRVEADDLGEDAAAAMLAEAIDPAHLRFSP